MPSLDKTGRLRSPARRIRLVGIFLLILGILLFGLNIWVKGKIESVVVERLGHRQLEGTWQSTSWTPWGGMHFKDLEVHRITDQKQIIAKVSNLNVHLPVSQYLNSGKRSTFWSLRNAQVTMVDEEGPITLLDVSVRLEIKQGKVIISKFHARKDALVADLTGGILTKKSETPNRSPFYLRLKAVRATLAALDFQGGGRFKVKGNFSADLSRPEMVWEAKLNGAGSSLEWKGFELSKAEAEASLSSASSRINASVSSGPAVARAVIERQDWGDSPFMFDGMLEDSSGQQDQFNGSYQNRVLTVESVEGRADLWNIARETLGNRVKFPDGITFKTFPMVDAKGIRWTRDSDSQWSVESITVKDADLIVRVKERNIDIQKLSGRISHDGTAWRLDDLSTPTIGGKISATGNYGNGKIRGARIQADGIRLSDVKHLADGGASKKGKGVLYMTYQGSIGLKGIDLNGKGKMRLEDAPVLEVPLLDEVYDLFASLIPGIEKSGEGRFDAEFNAKNNILEVTRFEAKGGTLTVSAVGTVDLEDKHVSGRARGKLLGLPGLLTSPLGRLLEMDVGGPFDNIRVKPLGPAKLVSNAASGTVGVAVDTVEETGRITGAILKEGIKVPFGFLKGDPEEEKPDEKSKPEVKRPAHRR